LLQHAPHLHGGCNYAAAALEEMHDLHEHPPKVDILHTGHSGAEEWDRVVAQERAAYARRSKVAEIKELVTGIHRPTKED
jgi:hypothetical protein